MKRPGSPGKGGKARRPGGKGGPRLGRDGTGEPPGSDIPAPDAAQPRRPGGKVGPRLGRDGTGAGPYIRAADELHPRRPDGKVSPDGRQPQDLPPREGGSQPLRRFPDRPEVDAAADAGILGEVAEGLLNDGAPAAGEATTDPMLLLPVRIETRFRNQEKPELLLRVYPDALHIDGHDPRLTPAEAALAEAHAPAFRAAKPQDAARLTAWAALTAQVGPHRAAFLLACILADDLKPGRKAEEAGPALARLLPARWRVRGYVAGAIVLDAAFSQPVAARLAASPLPEDLGDTGVKTAGALGWMADFGEARARGMAERFALPDTAAGGFDELVVLGIPPEPKEGPPQDGAAFAAHLQALAWSRGAGFLPQGTPTNNTEDARTGFTAAPPPGAEALDRLLPKGLNAPPEIPVADGTFGAPGPANVADGATLGAAIGAELPAGLPFADASGEALPRAMNQALWPVTWGAWLEELMGYTRGNTLDPPDFLTLADRLWLRDLFVGYLRGGAALPMLRVGDVPYGLALSARAARPRPGDPRRDRLWLLLQTLAPLWDAAAEALPRLADGVPRSDLGETLTEALARSPHPRDLAVSEVTSGTASVNSYWSWYRFALWEQNPHVDLVDARLGIRSRLAVNGGLPENSNSINQQKADIVGLIASSDLNLFDKRVAAYPWPASREADVEARRLSNGQMLPLTEPSAATINTINITVSGPNLSEAEALTFLVAVAETFILCENLLAHLDEHEARNEAFALAGAEPEVFKGPIGYGTEDPNIAFAFFGEEARAWPQERLVEIPGEDGAPPPLPAGAWLDHLIARARFHLGQGPDPPAPDWGAEGARPLLYELMTRGLESRRRALTAALSSTGQSTTGPQPRPPRRGAGRDAWAIRAYTGPAQRARADLWQMLDALLEMRRHGPGTLALALRQTLDLAGWRLDAFWQALLLQDLDATRAARPEGLRIGGYGYVEDLRPRWRGEGALVSESFVLAPSLTHAKTAALLRSGRQARGPGAAAEALDVNLSSARMREAAWVYDALRDGADLGDLLGQMAEAALARAGAGDLVDPLRRAVAELSGSTEAGRPAPPLDGLALAALWGADGSGRPALVQALRRSDGSAPARPARIRQAADEIAGLADAMGDLALADATFDLARGETARAAATLAAVADGSAPLPDLQVLKTPDIGPLVTLHTMLATGGEPEATGWPQGSLRAALDSASERLARQALGPAGGLRFQLTGKLRLTVPLPDLLAHLPEPLGALDLLSMALPGEGGSPLARALSRAAAALTGDREAALDPADPTGALLRIETWRASFMDARAALPEDLLSLGLPAGKAPPANTEGTAHEGHAAALKATLKALARRLTALRQALPPEGAELPADLTALHGALAVLAPFGAWGLADIPPPANAARRAALVETGRKVLAEMQARGAAAATPGKALTNAALRTAAKALFGPGLHVPPVLPAALGAGLSLSLTGAARRLPATGRTPLGWLADMGRTQPAPRAVAEALMAELAASATLPEAAIVQWPEPKDPEPWFAEHAPGASLGSVTSGGAALLLSRAEDPERLTEGFTALVLASQVDRIPPARRDAGLALELETPNAEAPQVMVLVLPEAPGEPPLQPVHGFSAVRGVMTWSRRRAGGGEALPELDQHLPAIFPSGSLFETAAALYPLAEEASP
ncbi:hypothetical protein [Pseudoroseicyclus sp. CXY001]|uniref:hypothetical protein n=1 Tax=Pseudoroseicyclus sp. CXY001 TaxID=3242492 RepID=UPI00358DC3A6